ncbi:hypothetical protein [Nocardia fluminea]|uniref:hypothetical protein n=1 Tax=Nocardia fluminea TaxID=134984 RepID=UPI003D0C729E
MANHTHLPTEATVRDHLAELRQRTGRTPSILALASRVGLSNTTFRRHFPDLCAELRANRRPAGDLAAGTEATEAYDRLHDDNQKLAARNRDLAADLDLAIAHIQRLTLENDQLRRQLHAARTVTHSPTAAHHAASDSRPAWRRPDRSRFADRSVLSS